MDAAAHICAHIPALQAHVFLSARNVLNKHVRVFLPH